MFDDVLMTEILRKGEDPDDPAVIAMYSTVTEKPKVLTRVPTKFALKRLSTKPQCGFAFEFISTYQRLADTPIEMGQLMFGDKTLVLDSECFYVLKAVAFLSSNKNSNKAQACRKVFQTLAMQAQRKTHLTKGELYEILTAWKEDDYYTSELLSGIRLTVFKDSEALYYYAKKVGELDSYHACYGFALSYIKQYFKTAKELDEFVNMEAKLARMDKEFMGRVKKKTSKYIYAFLYAFGKENPEIFEE